MQFQHSLPRIAFAKSERDPETLGMIAYNAQSAQNQCLPLNMDINDGDLWRILPSEDFQSKETISICTLNSSTKGLSSPSRGRRDGIDLIRRNPGTPSTPSRYRDLYGKHFKILRSETARAHNDDQADAECPASTPQLQRSHAETLCSVSDLLKYMNKNELHFSE